MAEKPSVRGTLDLCVQLSQGLRLARDSVISRTVIDTKVSLIMIVITNFIKYVLSSLQNAKYVSYISYD